MNNRFAILFDNFFLISDKTKNQLMNPISTLRSVDMYFLNLR